MKSTAHETGPALQFLTTLFSGAGLEQVAFQLWDGTRWPDDRPRAATLVLHHPDALTAMFAGGTETSLAEAYLRDEFDVVGDMEAAIEVADVLAERVRGDWLKRATTYFRLRRLGPAVTATGRSSRRVKSVGVEHSRTRDQHAISFHYDVSNEFFQQWLDSRLLYSCGYFKRPDDSLEAAQTAKLFHLCRKLRLRPGDRVLDIGCGWGGLALFAAEQFGVHVLGITLSAPQASLAKQRIADAGLEHQATIELRDYRDVDVGVPFDAVVSVGMSEHVGRSHLTGYFQKVSSLMKPGGVFLNHAIGEGVRPRVSTGPSFIQEYVFPDSDVPPIATVVAAGEAAGLEVRDVENLREHYMYTLRHWVHRLEANASVARRFVDEPTYRVWRLYMAAAAHGFDRCTLAIYQGLFSKPDAQGRAGLPLTREDWYPPAHD